MHLNKLFYSIASIAFLFISQMASASITPSTGDIYAKGELISVQPAAACGIILAGSPAIYRITSGPKELLGKQVTVLIACIEMPLIQGDLQSFVVGEPVYLVLTKQNIHKIELPSMLPSKTSYYHKAASHRELKPNYAIKGTSVETWHSSELSSGASVPYFGC
jgi:hypothetical protein